MTTVEALAGRAVPAGGPAPLAELLATTCGRPADGAVRFLSAAWGW